MPNAQAALASEEENSTPPSGEPKQADRYLKILIDLISIDKLFVSHSDLKKYDPTSLQDHFRIHLDDYDIEISHSKQPQSGKDSYVMLFTNTHLIRLGDAQKAILAYVYLSEEQFANFRKIAVAQIQRETKKIEEKRFQEVMSPVDNALEKLLNQQLNSDQETTGDTP